MAHYLVANRRFAPLFFCQVVSWFNDNFLKNTLVFLILFNVAEGSAALISLASAVYIVPFLFLSAPGGQIADRYDKAAILRGLKLVEIAGAVLATLGMAFQSLPTLFSSLLMFGVVSAFGVPVQYSILPEQMRPNELPTANAWLKGSVFLAKLGSTLSAGLLFTLDIAHLAFAPIIVTLAIACYLVSRMIPPTTAASPGLRVDWNIIKSTWEIFADLVRERRFLVIAAMTSWFWLISAMIFAVLPVFVKENMGGGESAVTFFLVVFAFSIGIGSAFAARLCAGRVVFLPSIIGTALMSVLCFDIHFVIAGVAEQHTSVPILDFIVQAHVIRIAIDVAGLAMAGGLLLVPTSVALQVWPEPGRRARTIAGASALGAALIVIFGTALAAAQKFGLSAPDAMLILSGLNAVAFVLMIRFLPVPLFGRPL
ncbi:MFS transporter [Stappia sp. WLB 29]|uniref:MFS transporter n=1 Tax=Stappia sp. WLB 29 TaxID=2925220 RepID=UPI0020C10DCA